MNEAEKAIMLPEHRQYLNKLRRSGRVNMFGASGYLAREFDLPMNEATEILKEWMAAFDPAVDA